MGVAYHHNEDFIALYPTYFAQHLIVHLLNQAEDQACSVGCVCPYIYIDHDVFLHLYHFMIPERLKFTPFKGLSELPTGRHDVVAGDGAAVAGGYSERQGLAIEESRLSQIKVAKRGIAPSTIVIRQGVVRWTEVGRDHGDGSWQAPFGIFTASQLVTRTAAQPTVEEGRAQGRRVSPVALAVQVPISTRSSCIVTTKVSTKARQTYQRAKT
ncbi:hypothetical protein RJ639_007287 [Escallonia herrerae]|uniref:Uncharacterized protein n=1 Tax=Escallonia herrerae TaxID=1293975 RepID=A0AA89ASN0_9ASTE|nr:hypothetical protein RJ639_007287 [Escallonia herrerae]